jgi:transcriptional regulator GlxA family with amidase domain
MNIVCLLFEEITALDAIGPFEVLARMPNAHVRFAAKERGPVRTDNGFLALHADVALAEVDACDLLLVPGGFGARKLQRDAQVHAWLRAIDRTTQVTATVCTGSLLLASAGLLSGRRATTHWAYFEQLSAHGALPVHERVVRDGKYASSAGVSAGIDLAIALALELCGREVAEAIQLSIEYDPAPTLDAGHPARVSPAVRDRMFRAAHARDGELA